MMGLHTLLLPWGVTVPKLRHDSSSRFMNHRFINHIVCVQQLTGVNRKKKKKYYDTVDDDKQLLLQLGLFNLQQSQW